MVSSTEEREEWWETRVVRGAELEGDVPIKEMRMTDYAEKTVYGGDKKVKKAIEMGIERRLDQLSPKLIWANAWTQIVKGLLRKGFYLNQ